MGREIFTSNGARYWLQNHSENTRNGFAHITNGWRTLDDENGHCIERTYLGNHRVPYLNRTWERYPYQTCMRGLMQRLLDDLYESIKDSYKTTMGLARVSHAHKRVIGKLYEAHPLRKEYLEVFQILDKGE